MWKLSYMSINIIDMGQEEESCSTHTCMLNRHYTKIAIVGCGTNCVDCEGYADWYTDSDGYVCCSACSEKWNDEGDGNGNCTCFQAQNYKKK